MGSVDVKHLVYLPTFSLTPTPHHSTITYTYTQTSRTHPPTYAHTLTHMEMQHNTARASWACQTNLTTASFVLQQAYIAKLSCKLLSQSVVNAVCHRFPSSVKLQQNSIDWTWSWKLTDPSFPMWHNIKFLFVQEIQNPMVKGRHEKTLPAKS